MKEREEINKDEIDYHHVLQGRSSKVALKR